jgi:hypothetical protein
VETSLARYAFRTLVLLACAIAGWGGEDPTPTREVVELVSVFDKPARMEVQAPGEPVEAQTVAQHANAAPRQEIAATRSARTSMTVPSKVNVSCRPPACRAAGTGKIAATKRTGARQERKAEPPLPAIFVPIRKLGLYLQARLGAPRDEKARGNRNR